MRTDTGAFFDANNAVSKSPRWTVVISFDDAHTDQMAITSHADGVGPTGVPIFTGRLVDLSLSSQKLNPDKAMASIGVGPFSVLEKSGDVSALIKTKLLAGMGLRKKRVQIYKGFENFSWVQYQLRMTTLIDKEISHHNGVTKFSTADIQRFVDETIFPTRQSFLLESLTEDQSYIKLATGDLTLFPVVAHDSSYSDRPNASVAYVKIGKDAGCEVIACGAQVIDPTHGMILPVLERGALNTGPTPGVGYAHTVDINKPVDRRPAVKEWVYLEGAAPKLARDMLTGGGYLPSHWHLGIAAEFVRDSDFTGIGADWWDTATNKGKTLSFQGLNKVRGKQFIEEQLMLWLGAFMPVYADGALGIKRLSRLLSNSSYVATLDKSNIKVGYQALRHNQDDVINEIDFLWNWNNRKDDFTKFDRVDDFASKALHKKARSRTLKFRGVHTGLHTMNDLVGMFNGLRDRYSNPPKKISLPLKPSMNVLEIGDPVRLVADQILDYTSSAANPISIDSVFEVQQIKEKMDGSITVDLFGSSGNVEPLKYSNDTVVMDDVFYDQGTDLTTVLTVVNGEITADGHLAGAADANNAIYHYNLGDLRLNPGVTITFDKNIRVLVKGFFTVDGVFDGSGGGLVGTAGATKRTDIALWVYSVDYTSGTSGLGKTQAQGSLGVNVVGGQEYTLYSAPVFGGLNEIPFFSVTNNGATLDGLPSTLMGSGGGGGGIVTTTGNTTTPSVTLAVGGAGGQGGSSVQGISRGLSVGASGRFITNGLAGSPGALYAAGNSYGGAGASGHPGGIWWGLDGNHPLPDIFGAASCNLAANGAIGTLVTEPLINARIYSAAEKPTSSGYVGFPAIGDVSDADKRDVCVRVQYLPPSITATLEQPALTHQLSAPTGLAVSTSSEPATIGANTALERVLVVWDGVTDQRLDAYQIHFRRSGVSAAWTSAGIIQAEAGSERLLLDGEQGVLYDFRIRSLSLDGPKGNSGWSATVSYRPPVLPPQVNWSNQISGVSKPADGATVGAVWGVDVSGVDTGAVSSSGSKSYDFPNIKSLGHWLPTPGNIVSPTWGTGADTNITGGGYLAASGGRCWLVHAEKIPVSNDLIELEVGVKFIGGGQMSCGWFGYDSDGNYVNSYGLNDYGSMYYHAADFVSGSGWAVFRGYTKGRGTTTGTTGSGTLSSPGQLHPSVAFISPVIVLNYINDPGVTVLNFVRHRVIQTAAETPYSDGQTIDALQPAEANAGDNQNVDWTAPALAAKEPAQAGADVTGTNVALGADTGSVGASAKRIFVNPASGELEVWSGAQLIESMGISTVGVDTIIHKILSTTQGVIGLDVSTSGHAIRGASSLGVAGDFVGSNDSAIRATSSTSFESMRVENTGNGTGVLSTTQGAGHAVVGSAQGGGAAFYAQSGAYLPFTGAHEVLIKNGTVLAAGDVVCLGDKFAFSGLSDFISVGRIARGHRDFAYGVITGIADISTIPEEQVAALKGATDQQIFDLIGNYRVATVNAVGEGLIPVCDETGQLKQGDLLMTSKSHPKRLCKQVTRRGRADHSIRNYTVAQVEDVTVQFDSNGFALAAVTYKRG